MTDITKLGFEHDGMKLALYEDGNVRLAKNVTNEYLIRAALAEQDATTGAQKGYFLPEKKTYIPVTLTGNIRIIYNSGEWSIPIGHLKNHDKDTKIIPIKEITKVEELCDIFDRNGGQ
jgi:hypothetical protein